MTPSPPRRLRPTIVWAAVPLWVWLLGILLALLSVALLVTGYGVQLVLRGYLVLQIDRQLVLTADNARSDGGFLQALLDADRRRFPSPFVVKASVDGSPDAPIVVRGYTFDPRVDLPDFPTVTSQQAAARGRTGYPVTASNGTRWRAVSFPALTPTRDGLLASASVTILQSLAGVDEAVERLRYLMLRIGALVLVACGLLGWLAIRRAFVPLRQVETTAAAIAAGDLSRRIPEQPPSTEVGRLTSSLNGMLAQIEVAFRAREASQARTRRFAADASHELRTPLASIRGFAELYRQGAVPAAEVPRVVRRIEDEATRMGGLVEDLLLLARLDEERPGRNEPVDLAVLAGDAVHDARGLDPERPVRLTGLDEAAGPVPAVVIGDEDRLRQVVGNLVANAVRHTPAGSPVEVAVGVRSTPGQAGDAVLEVRDHGPGLTAEQSDKVFERFYRVDSSRQRGQGGGSGLGLSIVAAVVAAHHGEVAVQVTAGGGATFVVRIPHSSPDTGPRRQTQPNGG